MLARVGFICALLLSPFIVHAVEIPNGYRMERYRALTPDHVPHAETLDTPALQALLHTEQPLLIDVMAVVFRPESLDFGGEWLLNEARYHIPNSVWLPNVGYGELNDLMQHYFQHNLQQLTAGDINHPVVFYCILDCWMAWNASKRAAEEFGYQRVYWYRDGMDGWEAAGLPSVEATPIAVTPSDRDQE